MTERRIGFDRATLSDKVIAETDSVLTMGAVIARELVQDYPQGRSYKPAEELEKAAWTGEGRWVAIMQHPDTGLITRGSDVKGRMTNVTFRKDIMDPKTKRPMVRGISADITWIKDKVPKQLLDDIKTGALKDVSIGFTYEQDDTPGDFEGEHYDFIQRNMFIDHVVAPCPTGRCPSPYCGIGVDAVLEEPKKPEVTESAEDCPVCQRINEVGLLESVKRLTMKFGVDVLTALEDDPPKPVIVPDAPVATPVEVVPEPSKEPETKPVEAPAPEAVEEAPETLEQLIERAEELLAMTKRLNKK